MHEQGTGKAGPDERQLPAPTQTNAENKSVDDAATVAPTQVQLLTEEDWEQADRHNDWLKNSGELQRRRDEAAGIEERKWSSYLYAYPAEGK